MDQSTTAGIKLSKEFKFEAAHFLPHVKEGHKCGRMHGHSYRVTIEVKGAVRLDGMMMDFADITKAWEPIGNALDHRLLNDIIPNPTSENLALWIVGQLKIAGLSAVTVRETQTSACRVEV